MISNLQRGILGYMSKIEQVAEMTGEFQHLIPIEGHPGKYTYRDLEVRTRTPEELRQMVIEALVEMHSQQTTVRSK